MIPGRLFSEMIRIWPKSQSYRPKVGVTDQISELQLGRPPDSEPNRLEKEPESGFGASTENPLKAFLNPPKRYLYTVIFEIITFLLQKHFKTVTVTVIFGKLIQMALKMAIGNQWR